MRSTGGSIETALTGVRPLKGPDCQNPEDDQIDNVSAWTYTKVRVP